MAENETATTPSEETQEVEEEVSLVHRELKPKGFDILPLTWKIESKDDVPATNGMPYYLFASEGLYIVRDGFLGRSMVPTKKYPPNLSSAGVWARGYFNYNAKPIPGEIMAQAVDFFRVVWDKHRTEAELLFLFNEEANQYKLFVPAQKVTSGSVKSLYRPEDVPTGWYVIGSIHSHCNFGAFHSGVDTNDASTFNGLHITVGHVDRENPEFAVMVAIDGLNFHYNHAIDRVCDVTRLDSKKSPANWLNFLLLDKSVGKSIRKEIAERLQSAIGTKTTTQPTTAPPVNYYGVNRGYPLWSDLYTRTKPGADRAYSLELRCNLPKNFFEPKGAYGGTGDLQYGYAPHAFEALLSDLKDIAKDKFDLQIDFEIIDLAVLQKAEEDELAKKADELSEDERVDVAALAGQEELDLREALLPPETEVPPEERENIHRQPLLH